MICRKPNVYKVVGWFDETDKVMGWWADSTDRNGPSVGPFDTESEAKAYAVEQTRTEREEHAACHSN